MICHGEFSRFLSEPGDVQFVNAEMLVYPWRVCFHALETIGKRGPGLIPLVIFSQVSMVYPYGVRMVYQVSF